MDQKVGTRATSKNETAQSVRPIVNVLVKRAERAQHAGAYSTALTICETIVNEAPNYAYGHFLRGQVLTHLHQYENAQAAFENVLDLNPSFPAIHFTLGNNAVHRGQYREALDHFKAEQAALSPGDSLVKKRATLLQMGRVYRQLGDIDKALTTLQQAKQLDENYAEVHNELGEIYQENGELAKALDARQRALELNPENGDYAYHVGTLLLQLGRPDEAIAHLQNAKEKRPWFYGAHYNLGRSLLAVGRTEEGERYLSTADSLQQRDAQLGRARTSAQTHGTPETWMTYADMLYESKRYEEALTAYQVVRSMDPQNATAAQAISTLKERLTER